MQDSITSYSYRLGEAVLSRTIDSARKELGQFLTPPAVACYMAWQLGPLQSGQRILDPAIGSGVLSCAIVERAITEQKPIELWIDGFDVDESMCEAARESLRHAAAIAAQSDISIHFYVEQRDFTLQNMPSQQSLLAGCAFAETQTQQYDHIIANPPYFKLRNDDPRARLFTAQKISHTNIYTLFIALAISRLANEQSHACFIIPRSFCSGAYFADFRRYFLQQARPLAVHLFESRNDVFEDEVLQESLILTFSQKALKAAQNIEEEWVNVSTSSNINDLAVAAAGRRISLAKFWHSHGGEYFFKLPLSDLDEQIIETVERWPDSLGSLNLEVSTGPVVPFRANGFLMQADDVSNDEAVPLLWLQHVKPQAIEWPAQNFRKPQAISLQSRQAKLLTPAGNYVLIRRFSAKEERRRLIAAPLLKTTLPFAHIGIENHLNFIWKKQGELAPEEAVGLSALYNSALIDRYFRIVNGHTQVNATELRRLPLPSLSVLQGIGRAVLHTAVSLSFEEVEKIATSTLRKKGFLPDDLPNIEESNMAIKKLTKIQQAQDVLRAFGLPPAQQNEQSALTLLVLCQLSEDTAWKAAASAPLRIHDILAAIKALYGRDYAENTRETIRRQVIHQFEQAGIVVRNAGNPDLPTNSPRTQYTISGEALSVIRQYKTRGWLNAVAEFNEIKGALVDVYQQAREHNKVPLKLASGQNYFLSPGKHNQLQAAIINEFGPRFAPNAQLLYLGDTAKKDLIFDATALELLAIPTSTHDKLPDVVLFDPIKNWLFLIEAVTSHGPITPKRQIELQAMLKRCTAKCIFVSAFPDFATFKSFSNKIAWETEVWLADMPSHMIHYNGDKFLGPH
jgi:adenine-specific DNA-methyltransferase